MATYLSKRWFFLLAILALWLVNNHPEWADGTIKRADVRWLTALNLFFAALTMSGARAVDGLKRMKAAVLSLTIILAVAPLAAYAASCCMEGDLRIGMLLVGILPCTIASATVWTRLAGGNDSVAILIAFTAHVLFGVISPFWLQLFLGEDSPAQSRSLIIDCQLYVTMPILFGRMLCFFPPISASADRRRKSIGVLSRFLTLLVIVKAALQVRPQLQSSSSDWSVRAILICSLLCLALHGLLWGVAWFVSMRGFERGDAIAVSFAGSQKSLPVGALLVDQFFPLQSLAIFPILIFHFGQLILGTILAERIFRLTKAGRPGEFVEKRIAVLENDPPVEI